MITFFWIFTFFVEFFSCAFMMKNKFQWKKNVEEMENEEEKTDFIEN